jgi:hypothetical protein
MRYSEVSTDGLSTAMASTSIRHRDLLEARKAIEVALSAMTATQWLTEAQYEHAEKA